MVKCMIPQALLIEDCETKYVSFMQKQSVQIRFIKEISRVRRKSFLFMEDFSIDNKIGFCLKVL